MELTPDTLLRNRYRIVRLLGQGGMGAVYLAYDTSLEHEVAVKVNRNPNPHTTDQFLKEARLLAALRHPNLPRVIDYFIEGIHQYLVMDYIAGDDLKTLLEQGGPISYEKVQRWAEQLGSALSYLHHQNPPVIHRDIKPGNIKLTPEGDAILVDFGIAKSAGSDQATATGAIGYTPGYAPPEQYGTGRTGPYSDQYAFAATLYALLTGQRPPDSVQRVLGAVTLTPANQLNPGISQNISSALDRAMSVRPEDRYLDVKDMVQVMVDPNYQPTIPTSLATPQAYYQEDVATMAYPYGGNQVQPPPPPPPVLPIASPIAKPKFPVMWILIGVIILALVVTGFILIPQILPNAAPTASMTAPVVAMATTQSPSQTPQPTATETPRPSPLPTRTFTSLPTSTNTIAPSPTVGFNYLGKGAKIAFVSDRADGKTFQIWTMQVFLNDQNKVAASIPEQLTTDPSSKSQPAWSPDGTKLLYVAASGKPGDDKGLDIFMMDVANPSAPAVDLSNRVGDDTDPSWSPDGEWIAFTNNANNLRMVFLMDKNGGQQKRLSQNQEEFSPTWSKDLKWLAVVTRGYNDSNFITLRGPEPDYSATQTFDTKNNANQRTGATNYLAWSPDGQQIAYTRLQSVVLGSIYTAIFSKRGDQLIPLTNSGRDSDPAWSSDSQWVVFTRMDENKNTEIYIVRAQGLNANLTNLTNSPSHDMQPAWQVLK